MGKKSGKLKSFAFLKHTKRYLYLDSISERDEGHPILILPPRKRFPRGPTFGCHGDRRGPVGRSGRGRDVSALPPADDDETSGGQNRDDGTADAYDAQDGQQWNVGVFGVVPTGI